MATRTDPLRGFRFLVEIDGIAVGGFLRAKGLVREVKYESQREGGVNHYEHKLFSQVTHPAVVLERGLAFDQLWNWAHDVSEGRIVRKTISVRLLDERGGKGWTWHVDNAFPVKWSSADLDANSSQVLMESVEFVHHGLRKGS
ncbi:phage tail protein [Burkholderia sp. LMU1-1-1.1]|uniref:phage tail protein n=1 Tax=Burkholderia sp. LMU1-1-1.1 TaxID=3135266 RepID=UPI003424BDE6